MEMNLSKPAVSGCFSRDVRVNKPSMDGLEHVFLNVGMLSGCFCLVSYKVGSGCIQNSFKKHCTSRVLDGSEGEHKQDDDDDDDDPSCSDDDIMSSGYSF